MTGRDLGRLARTAVHLHPGQITRRARLRAQRLAVRRFPPARRWLLAGPDPASAAGWPAGFSPLDSRLWLSWPGLRQLAGGRIGLLGMTRTLTGPDGHRHAHGAQDDPADGDWVTAHWSSADWAGADWGQPDAPALWRYHLHYFDWAWALTGEPDRQDAQEAFGTIWRSWHGAVRAGLGEAWHPYPAALRAWSFCGLHRDLVAGTALEGLFLASLSAHAGFLRRSLESDVGGNHLVKNLKALAGLGVFFADDRLSGWALGRLARQLAIQVLPDGGHYERAPAYHCQVLADLIDVDGLLRATGREPQPELTDAISRMRAWLGSVLTPDGRVPLLNDGYPVDARLVSLLRPGPAPAGGLVLLPDSGLVRMAAGGWFVLADVGQPCPGELPAHAHADTFGCLVHAAGAPLLVDTGTSTYAAGPVRSYERSTAAHNTVELDGTDSTEVWGAFRAARRARVSHVATTAGGGLLTAAAVHDGFRARPGRPRHRRRWSLTETGLRVDDLVTGGGRHAVTLRWHLAPGSELRLAAGGALVRAAGREYRVLISAPGPVTLAAESSPVATGFGQTVSAWVLTCRVTCTLPVRLSTSFQCATQASTEASSKISREPGMEASQAGPGEFPAAVGGAG